MKSKSPPFALAAVGLIALGSPIAVLADTVAYEITGVNLQCSYGACPISVPISFSPDTADTVDTSTFLAVDGLMQTGSEAGVIVAPTCSQARPRAGTYPDPYGNRRTPMALCSISTTSTWLSPPVSKKVCNSMSNTIMLRARIG